MKNYNTDSLEGTKIIMQKSAFQGKASTSNCIGLSRYIATTTLAITAVFLEYLRQFLIDLHQIYRHSSVPKKHVSVHFFSFLAQAVSEHGAAATFFLSRNLPGNLPGVATPVPREVEVDVTRWTWRTISP